MITLFCNCLPHSKISHLIISLFCDFLPHPKISHLIIMLFCDCLPHPKISHLIIMLFCNFLPHPKISHLIITLFCDFLPHPKILHLIIRHLTHRGARYSSVVEHSLMVCWIIRSFLHGGPIELLLISSQCSMTGVTKAVVCNVLSVGLCI